MSETTIERTEDAEAEAPAEAAVDPVMEVPFETADEEVAEIPAAAAKEAVNEDPGESTDETVAEAPAEVAEEAVDEDPGESTEEAVAEASAEDEEEAPAQSEDKLLLEMPSVELLEAELRKSRYRSNYRRVLRSTFFSLLAVAAVAVIVAVLLMPVLRIRGTSMSTTLEDGDLVVAINNSKYQTGDVIGFYFNNGILIKRMIAAAGDWVDIDEEGTVYVNGKRLDEPYVTEKSKGECNITLPYQVPEGKCFVMGDHRETSIDSRNTAVGCIENDMVVGRLLLRIWPLNAFGGVR